MNEKIKILIGDDTAQFGVSVASKLRTDGFYVITRPKKRHSDSRRCGIGKT